MTIYPETRDASALSGRWERSLAIAIQAVAKWSASAVVTLMEEPELRQRHVGDIGDAIENEEIDWYFLPIRNGSVPDRQAMPESLLESSSGSIVI